MRGWKPPRPNFQVNARKITHGGLWQPLTAAGLIRRFFPLAQQVDSRHHYVQVDILFDNRGTQEVVLNCRR